MTRRTRNPLTRWRSTEPDDASLPHSIFLRGLTLGALIGAAVAGSAIWDRRRLRHAAELPEPGPEPVEGATDSTDPAG